MGQRIINFVPGAYYAGQSQLAWEQGRYWYGAALYGAALADAFVGVATLGKGRWQAEQSEVVRDLSVLEVIGKRSPFAAQLRQAGARLDHLVVVMMRAASDQSRDPWGGGSTYRMTMDEFLKVWNGNAVFR